MLVTITTLSDKMSCFDVSPDMHLVALKDLCSAEFKVQATVISLFFNGNLLDNDASKSIRNDSTVLNTIHNRFIYLSDCYFNTKFLNVQKNSKSTALQMAKCY